MPSLPKGRTLEEFKPLMPAEKKSFTPWPQARPQSPAKAGRQSRAMPARYAPNSSAFWPSAVTPTHRRTKKALSCVGPGPVWLGAMRK